MLREDIKGLMRATPRDLRSFGLTVGGVFCTLGLLCGLRHIPYWPWFVAPGVPLVVLGAMAPRILRWIYVGWITLAMLLGAVVSTVLLTLLFFLVVTPMGLAARLAGKDFLSRKLEPGAASYWLVRDISTPKAKHEHQQQY
ncbi:MAG: SxtJ family membrane protein [Verrucomicrobia bacterium]|nr:SxtJ family membrane protein [Verrucomicrobiota bacterium]